MDPHQKGGSQQGGGEGGAAAVFRQVADLDAQRRRLAELRAARSGSGNLRSAAASSGMLRSAPAVVDASGSGGSSLASRIIRPTSGADLPQGERSQQPVPPLQMAAPRAQSSTARTPAALPVESPATAPTNESASAKILPTAAASTTTASASVLQGTSNHRRDSTAAAVVMNNDDQVLNASVTSSMMEITPRPSFSRISQQDPRDALATLAARCQQYQCRVEQGHLYCWCIEDRNKKMMMEHNARIVLFADMIHCAALIHSSLQSQHNELQCRWDAAHNVPPTKRLLAILGADQRNNKTAMTATNDDDVEIPDEVAIDLLAQYKQDRDDTEHRLQQQLASAVRECGALRTQVQELNTTIQQQQKQQQSSLIGVSDFGIGNSSSLQGGKMLEESRRELDKLIAEKQTWIHAIRDAEEESAELHDKLQHVLRDREKRENEILAACKEGEARAIEMVQLDHAAAMTKIEAELTYIKKRKNFYKEKCGKLEALHEEWLAAKQQMLAMEASAAGGHNKESAARDASRSLGRSSIGGHGGYGYGGNVQSSSSVDVVAMKSRQHAAEAAGMRRRIAALEQSIESMK